MTSSSHRLDLLSRPVDHSRREDLDAEAVIRAPHVPRLDRGRDRLWTTQYFRLLLIFDVISVAVAMAVGFVVTAAVSTTVDGGRYAVTAAVVFATWLLLVQSVGGYEVRRISTGAREFQLVLRAGMATAGAVAVVGVLAALPGIRAFVVFVVPAGTLLMLMSRYIVRHVVHVVRARGQWTSTILAVGSMDAVRHLVEVTDRCPRAGLVVVGACVEGSTPGTNIESGVPVVGGISEVAARAAELDADIVAVADGLSPRRIRELAWALEGTGRSMVMAPGLTGVAGPRVHISPVEGLPLVWLDEPQLTGMRSVVKRVFDIVTSSLMLLILAPLLLVTAALVKLTSRGPILFKQVRLGHLGKPVKVLKFRTMYEDAEQRRDELVHLNESDNLLFFKVRDDPRITPLGRFLRRYSLDELPQLINVLLGSMSLVGPRPLPGTIELYDHDFRRRMLVKPGLTGLWQVSGRSDLNADDAARLDLYYAENWSLTMDLSIVLRTAWVVVRSHGAY